ncbi:MAG TPA: hypothetical protein DD640_07820 [Clostridiales bacterium]|nr:hypothetical protein [Clostridiales bacterium]
MSRYSVRIFVVFISFLLLLYINAGCDVNALVRYETTGASAGGQMETSPATHQYTDDLQTVRILPRSVIDALGTGCRADIVLAIAGLQASQILTGHYRFQVAEDENIICELQIVRHAGDLVIKTAIQSDASGHKLLFSPTPDPQVIDDFQMISSTLQLDVGEYHSESDLLKTFGMPLQVNNLVETADPATEQLVQHRVRTLCFLDLTIILRQDMEPEDYDSWLVREIIWTSAEYASPRGLAVGLTYDEVLDLLGTGDFNLYPDALPMPTNLVIRKEDSVNDGAQKQIDLLLRDGKTISIMIIYTGS